MNGKGNPPYCTVSTVSEIYSKLGFISDSEATH